MSAPSIISPLMPEKQSRYNTLFIILPPANSKLKTICNSVFQLLDLFYIILTLKSVMVMLNV